MNHLSSWGRAYVVLVSALGALTVLHSALELYLSPVSKNWMFLAVLTLLSGSATVKLPSVPATISISETFVFTSVLLFGPAVGTIIVALDALVISLWLAWKGHPFYRVIFNIFALPAALWVGARLYYLIGDVPALHTLSSGDEVEISRLMLPLFAFTFTYFSLNSWLIAIAISLEKRISPVVVWRENLALLSLNYFGGASVAALLVTYTQDIDYTYLAFVLPLLAVLYFTFWVSMRRVEDTNRHLSELNKLYLSTIETLAMAIDAKDQITHGHIRRVQLYAVGLARTMGVTDSAQISAIEAASLLHDMGKLAVPEYILNKPGRLTPAEFEKMKMHASVGADILSAIDFPYPVVPIVRHHHENWDGNGYPDGLRGSDIPIGARILAVVDCFDALTSDRPYRPRLSDHEAIEILVNRRGTMYDPLVVDTFVRVYADISPQIEDSSHVKGSLTAIAHRFAFNEESGQSGLRLNDIAASTEEMLVLYDLAQCLTARLDVGEAADLIAKHLRRVVPASTTVVYLYDSETDELLAAHATGDSASHFADLRIPRGQRLTGWVAANRRSILNSDPVLDLGEAARSLRPPLRSCLSAPVLAGEQLVGVLTVYSVHRDAFSEEHRRILEVVGRQVSQTLQRASLAGQDRSSSQTEPVGPFASSASHLERVVATEVAQANRFVHLSLILIRVHFSDAYGGRIPANHSDQVIEVIARVIRTALRDADLLFDYGTRQFLVLLLRTDYDTAVSVADRILRRCATARKLQQLPGDTVVSLGIATAPEDGVGLDSLLDAARKQERVLDDSPTSPPSVH